MNKEYKKLLECLEDITGQMQMEKITFEEACETLKSITKYYEGEKKGERKWKEERIKN